MRITEPRVRRREDDPVLRRRRGPVSRTSLRYRRQAFGYGLLAPQVVGFALIGIYALGRVVWLSLQHINVLSRTQEFVGLDNYRKLVRDPSMGIVIPNTLFFVALLSIAGTVVALGLALLLNQKLPGINVFRAIIFVPALITMVAWILVWRFILQPKGLLDAIVSGVGVPELPWLRSRWLTLVVLVMVQLLKNVGINVMIFLAALQSVSAELVEAARIDGAGRWRAFRHIVIPQISPSILMVFMLMITGSFKVFEEVLLLTAGGPGVSTSVLSYEIYKEAFKFNDIGYGSALSVLLFAAVLVAVAIIWRLRSAFVFYEDN